MRPEAPDFRFDDPFGLPEPLPYEEAAPPTRPYTVDEWETLQLEINDPPTLRGP